MEDTFNILKAMKITPKRICYYTAAAWKWQVSLKILDKSMAGETKINELMKEFASDKDLKPHMKDIASLVPKIMKTLTKLPSERKTNKLNIKVVNEKEILESTIVFLKTRFNAEISVYNEADQTYYDPKNRSIMSIPGQPAIYVE